MPYHGHRREGHGWWVYWCREEGLPFQGFCLLKRNRTGGFQLDVKVRRGGVALEKDEGGSGPPREIELCPQPREV